jgi:hypothetical protein
MESKYKVGDLVMYVGDEEWELGSDPPVKFGKIYEIIGMDLNYRAWVPKYISKNEYIDTNIYLLKTESIPGSWFVRESWWVREKVLIKM